MKHLWPHADASRFIRAAALDWHVQTFGAGPAILLLHGSGAASHSWRDIAPRLALTHSVIVPDLPGHGLTSRPVDDRFTLDAMAEDLGTLLATLGAQPVAIAGHSAGAAIALRMALTCEASDPLNAVIGVNAALSTPSGIATTLFEPVRALARTPFVASFTAMLAESDTIFRGLLASTGSRVSAEQSELYRTFARSPEHTSALMRMFSSWDVNPMLTALPSLKTPVTFIVGANDDWVPPSQSERVARALPNARVVTLGGAGHLAHEELPARVADIISEAALGLRTAGSGKGATGAQ